MGWKASVIIVHKPTEVNKDKLLKDLGFYNLKKIEDEPFGAVINPNGNKVYMGTYKDNLLICTPDLPMQFFEANKTETELTFNRFFPQSEICSIVLHSVVNLWAYSVTINGKKLRARAGSADDGTFLEIGEPLEEEKELLSKSEMDENGNRVYMFEDLTDEPCSEDQVGENFVFAICKRYFDEELDRADDLFETVMEGFSFGSDMEIPNIPKQEQSVPVKSKPWWKRFVGGL